MTKVAVHITTRNRCSLLQRCIDSVLTQTYTHLEINILSDASTDGTRELVQRYQLTDPRIHFYEHPHRRGNAASRNRLLQSTDAPFIAFLDDDDYWTDVDKISKQMACMEEIAAAEPERAVIIASGVARESPAGIGEHPCPLPHDMDRQILCGNGFLFNSTILTSRRTLELTGGFDERLKRGVDSEFFRCAIIRHSAKVVILPDITTVFRDFGPRMTTAGSFGDRRDVARAHFHIIRKYFTEFLKHPGCLANRLGRLAGALIKRHPV